MVLWTKLLKLWTATHKFTSDFLLTFLQKSSSSSTTIEAKPSVLLRSCLRLSFWVNDYTSSTQWWWLWFHSSLGYQSHVRVCKRVCHSTPTSLSLLSGGVWWSPSASMLGRTLKWHGWCSCSLSPAGSGQARYCLPHRVWHAPLWEARSPRVRCTADNTYISIYPLLITHALSNQGDKSQCLMNYGLVKHASVMNTREVESL